MKISPFLVIVVCLSFLAGYPAHGQDTNKITCSINLVNVPVDKVLDDYKGIAGAELVVASDVRFIHGITVSARAVSPDVAQHLIEQALLKQAGIVITRLDDQRVSVTYNDQLKLEP